MANWKSIVEKQNKSTYRWPAGWDTREKVALDLECSPERVASLLAPGIKAGEIEVRQFRVWDDALKRIVSLTGYRQAPKAAAPNATPAHEDRLMVFIRRHIARRPAQIRDRLPKDLRKTTTAAEIAKIKCKMQNVE